MFTMTKQVIRMAHVGGQLFPQCVDLIRSLDCGGLAFTVYLLIPPVRNCLPVPAHRRQLWLVCRVDCTHPLGFVSHRGCPQNGRFPSVSLQSFKPLLEKGPKCLIFCWIFSSAEDAHLLEKALLAPF